MSAPDLYEQTFRRYAAGALGTRETMGLLDLDSYADIIVGLARFDLPFPKPDDTPERRAAVARAREILEPLLRLPGRP